MALIQPVWHLATNSLAGRPTRTALLVLAVALATVLTVAVAAAIGTLTSSIELAMGRIAGRADAQVRHRHHGRIPLDLLQQIRDWPEVLVAGPRFDASATLANPRTQRSAVVTLRGIDPAADALLNPRDLRQGRLVAHEGEVVLDQRAAESLDVRVGDTLDLRRFGQPLQLRVVGLMHMPALAALIPPRGIVTLAQAQTIDTRADLLDQIDLQLRPGHDVAAFQKTREPLLPHDARIQIAAAAEARLNQRIDASRLLMLVTTVLVSLSAGFLILTSLTTSVNERLRELAILRCIGATRAQIASSQLLAGLLISGAGALVGTPLGLLGAYLLYRRHTDLLAAGFDPGASNLAMAIGGALAAGLLGASYPALLAANVRPSRALAVRAKAPRPANAIACALAGLALVLIQPLVMALPLDTQTAFWFYAYLGLPCTFSGYFLLSVPVLFLVVPLASPLIARLLHLPADLLRQAVLATPFRHAFTGGALMIGLAMIVGIWTGNRSVMTGWFDQLKFPDAFIYSARELTEPQWHAIQQLPGVRAACPTTMFPVEMVGGGFGVKQFGSANTLLVSFEPDAFFRMADLQWIQGDPDHALARLNQGRALLVSREFLVARNVGVGSHLTLTTLDGPVSFEIVGVVGSVGLDLAVQVFGMHRAYADAAVSCVFASRADAQRGFGNTSITMALLDLAPGVTDESIQQAVERTVPGAAFGSSRIIRQRAQTAADSFTAVASSLGIAALLIACLGVANLIIAEVAARRFEYGVLRAIGASRAMLGRLILGQTLLLALVGCVTGTVLGAQLALVGWRFHQRLLGLEYTPRMPWDVVAAGAAAVLSAAALAALPAIWRLMRQSPRALLAAGRGA